MNQLEFVLAAMAPAEGAKHTPVQVQKLLFLMDKNIGARLGGPYFDFKPYDYGPFDRAVYDALESLEESGEVSIDRASNNYTRYSLTTLGQDQAKHIFDELEPSVQEYIREASSFVRRLSFSDLVKSIYKAYPDMQEKSVFRG